MKIKFIVLSLLSIFCENAESMAQGLNTFWTYGYFNGGRGNIDFFSGLPVVSPDIFRTINFQQANANIANSSGNILFYTNGIVVCNANNDTMSNGKGLNPSPYTTTHLNLGLLISQANLVFQLPGDPSQYYIIHETIDQNINYLTFYAYYSIIDMSLNGGLGDVVQKNIIFIQDTLARGQITACKHANGRDWWLVIPEYLHPAYFIYLVSPSGIQFHSKQTIGARIYEGQAAFSPNGEHYGCYNNVDDIEIFDFDRCTGLFSNYRHVEINDSNYGIGFSFAPNSKLAYASSAHFLYQVNLDSTTLQNSLITVAVWDSTYSPSAPFETGFDLQLLAPDGKIYFATTFATDYLHKIDVPDSVGLNCNVMQHTVLLAGINGNTVPNHPNYFLGPVVGSVCDSLGLGIDESIYNENINLIINPNPAQNIFNVNYQLPANINAEMKIFSAVGEMVMKKRLYSYFGYLQVDGSSLDNGIYFINVVTDDKHSFNAKLIIAR